MVANIPPMQVFGDLLFTPELIHRGCHYWFFQMALADGVVAAADFALIDDIWARWSPGYDAAEDLRRAKDCIREPANLAAALGYYRSTFNPARMGSEEWAAEQGAAWGALPSQPTLYLHGTTDGVTPPSATTPSPRSVRSCPRAPRRPGSRTRATSSSWNSPGRSTAGSSSSSKPRSELSAAGAGDPGIRLRRGGRVRSCRLATLRGQVPPAGSRT